MSFLEKFQNKHIVSGLFTDAVVGKIARYNDPESHKGRAKDIESARRRLALFLNERLEAPHITQDEAYKGILCDFKALSSQLESKETAEYLSEIFARYTRSVSTEDLCTDPQWALLTSLGYTGARPYRQDAGRLIAKWKK